ncbi:MAG: hypothetical protein IJY25_00740 [Bacilli bacterium]|nr:hypothetical protein [Bacilli bacterium]
MFVDGHYIDESELVANESKFIKKHNNIYITDEQVSILKKYGIVVEKYNNMSELIYDIEEYLNESDGGFDDLEWVSQTLSEYNYYNNTNK